jgi:hypothetical protein
LDRADNLAQIAEAEKLVGRLDRELCAEAGAYDRTDGAAVLALHAYVEELLMTERQPTLRKIYQTISFECIAMIRPLALPETIAKNAPLFFDVAAEALKAQPNEVLQLCELHHQHGRAIEYIWPDQRKSPPESVLDRLIAYISRSDDVLTLATQYLLRVANSFREHFSRSSPGDDSRERALDRAVGLYFSRSLTWEKIDEASRQIGDHRDFEKCDQQWMQAQFLAFAVFEIGDQRKIIHEQLIGLYLALLQDYVAARRERKPVPISGETSPVVRSLREGLVRILDGSDSYDAKKRFREIPSCYLEERLAAQRKANDIKEAIETVADKDVPLDIAIRFCEKVYDENDPEKRDVFTHLFFCLNRSNTGDNRKLLQLLNSCAEKLDPVKIIENIPKTVPLAQLKEYLKLSSLARINKLRSLRIRNALMAATIEAKRVQLSCLQSGKVEEKNNLICVFCGKAITLHTWNAKLRSEGDGKHKRS